MSIERINLYLPSSYGFIERLRRFRAEIDMQGRIN
jgi:hypothetical protein